MPFSIATWNINSVRLRMPIVERLLVEQAPDVLCLQETKVPDELFPEKAFRKLGYEYIAFHGQKGYHGVATVARRPIEVVEKRRFCEIDDSRHLSVTVWAGGKDPAAQFLCPCRWRQPDPEINRKFRHKLDFVAEMNAIRAEHDEVSARSWSRSQYRAADTMSGRKAAAQRGQTSVRRKLRGDAAGRRLGRPMRLNVPERSSTRGGAIAPRIGKRPAARLYLVVAEPALSFAGYKSCAGARLNGCRCSRIARFDLG
jgi:hypothetical protein